MAESCIHLSVCVCLYSFTNINKGLWLSVFGAGNDSVDKHGQIKHDKVTFFFFFTLEVVTVDVDV